MQNKDNPNGCNVTAVNSMSTHRRQTLPRALVFGSSERLPGGTDGSVRRVLLLVLAGWLCAGGVRQKALAEQACRVCQCSHRPQLKLHYANECLRAKVGIHCLLILQTNRVSKLRDEMIEQWKCRTTDWPMLRSWRNERRMTQQADRNVMHSKTPI